MSFSCKLEKDKLSVDISVNYKNVDVSHHCLSDEQAEQVAKHMTQKHMQQGWKLVMLNRKKVKQGTILMPSSSTISKIERAPAYIRPRILNDGTVGRQEGE